ncbi:hypothetical protein [Algibacter sp. R77976]|uniref:hypothetical protein n=1 Tax=Algibacter sp. R77976 TaxID=3093873 RepID=UPI0037C7DB4A
MAQGKDLSVPIIDKTVIFEEQNGIVAIEAEFFHKQTITDTRKWYRTSKHEMVTVGRDDDNNHWVGTSNNTYIEILPDSRVTHSDKLIRGENFTNEPGKMAILHYQVKINSPGRYFVWVRAFSTGGEDNGLHVGLNGEWPEHGQKMQWCKGKNQWTWESKQRTKEEHCGIPHAIYLDINKAGVHNVQFSMREDGFEFDKFILTKDVNYVPTDKGPQILANRNLPESFNPKKSYFSTISKTRTDNKYIAAQDFPIEGTNFYKNGKNWLAINPEKYKQAETSTIFNFKSGRYDIVFVGVGENDGNSNFKVFINQKKIGEYNPPLTDSLFEEGKKYNALWKRVKIKKGDKITVTGKVATDGNEWTRARWAGIIFAPCGKGKDIQDAPSSYSQN